MRKYVCKIIGYNSQKNKYTFFPRCCQIIFLCLLLSLFSFANASTRCGTCSNPTGFQSHSLGGLFKFEPSSVGNLIRYYPATDYASNICSVAIDPLPSVSSGYSYATKLGVLDVNCSELVGFSDACALSAYGENGEAIVRPNCDFMNCNVTACLNDYLVCNTSESCASAGFCAATAALAQPIMNRERAKCEGVGGRFGGDIAYNAGIGYCVNATCNDCYTEKWNNEILEYRTNECCQVGSEPSTDFSSSCTIPSAGSIGVTYSDANPFRYGGCAGLAGTGDNLCNVDYCAIHPDDLENCVCPDNPDAEGCPHNCITNPEHPSCPSSSSSGGEGDSSSSNEEPSSSSSRDPSSSSDEPSSSSSDNPSSSSDEKPSSSSSSSEPEPSSSSSKIASSSSSKLESSSSNYWYIGGDESVECQTDIMSSGPYLIGNQTVYVYGNDAYNTSGQYLGDANKVVFSKIPSILAKDKTAVRDMRLYMKPQNYLRKQDSKFSGSVSFLQKTGLDGYVAAWHSYGIKWDVKEARCMCNPPETRMVRLYMNMSLKTTVEKIEHKDDPLLMAHENRHKKIYESILGNVSFVDSSLRVNFCEKDRSKWCQKIEEKAKWRFEEKLRNLIKKQNEWDDMDKNNVSHERINLDEKLNEMRKNVKDGLEKYCWERYRSILK